jgi:hypothetical protein
MEVSIGYDFYWTLYMGIPCRYGVLRIFSLPSWIVFADRKACSGAISALVKASTLTASIQASISISSSGATTQSIRPYCDGGDSGITYLFLA